MAAKKGKKKTVTDSVAVLITCGTRKEAKAIARALVERKLAACVNWLPTSVESFYRWKGEVDSAGEFVLIAKTTRRRFAALQSEVRRLHSYDVPEIIALPIVGGSRDYLSWIAESVTAPKP